MPDPNRLLRIRSEVLGEEIWLASDTFRFRPDNPAAPHLLGGLVVYRAHEVRFLRHMTPDALRLVHEVKRAFGGSVEDASSQVAVTFANNYPYREKERISA